MSGARSSTLARRLPFLPACDAMASEGGGRLYWVGRRGVPTACDLEEDAEWRDVHAGVAGPASAEGLPPAARPGALWDAYRSFAAAGWAPDAASYATSFRLPLPPGRADADLAAALAALPPCLAAARNLGCADVFPATSGKAAVGKRVAAALGADLADCILLCDDHNDLGLAAAVGRVFVVGATDASVAAAAAADPAKFWTTPLLGTRAADAAVEAALNEVVQRATGVGRGGRMQAERCSALAG